MVFFLLKFKQPLWRNAKTVYTLQFCARGYFFIGQLNEQLKNWPTWPIMLHICGVIKLQTELYIFNIPFKLMQRALLKSNLFNFKKVHIFKKKSSRPIVIKYLS